MVGRARQSDDVAAVRRLDAAIQAGNKVFTDWAQQTGGSIVEAGGDEFAIEVPADRLDELPKIRESYREVVGATVSIGVGLKLSEASKALLASKLKGKDCVTFYTEEVEELVAKAAQQPQDEAQKIRDEYLTKAAPAMHSGAFAGASAPSAATVDRPTPTQGEHSEAQDVYDLLESSAAPPPPERTHAARDFERELHDEAWKGEEEDMRQDVQAKQSFDQVKQQVAQALVQLKAQAPLLEQVKSVAPGAYKALAQLAQAVIAMARQLPSARPEPMKKHDRVTATRHPRRASDADIYRYVAALHTGSRADLNRVPMDADFQLADVPLDRLPALRQPDEAAVQRYAARPTPFPPIVVGFGGQVPDGHHRIAAARLRGDRTIRAYVPEGELERYVGKKIKKSESQPFTEGCWPATADDAEISAYFARVHLGGRHDLNRVPYDTQYVLREVPVDHLVSAVPVDNPTAQRYAALPTPFPPLIMKTEGVQPLDGNHRLAAAKIRGDRTIRVYAPLQKGGDDRAAELVGKVRSALADDLQKPDYKGQKGCVDGHCYVLNEALHHLLGGREGGWESRMVVHEGGPHWFLQHKGGRVLDAAADQFQTQVPYHLGRRQPFLTELPTERAQEVIQNVLAPAEEPVGKAEQIGDDPRGLVVYRVQNKDGVGTYWNSPDEVHDAATAKLGSPRRQAHGIVTTQGSGKGGRQPFPRSEFAHITDWGDTPLEHLRFGFESPVHAREWFGNDALAAMKARGWDLVPVRAKRVWRSKSGRQVAFVPHQEELDKAKLPESQPPPAHHRVVLPPGSAIGQARSGAVGTVAAANKVKVQHSDGGTSVVQVQAGQVRSQDPSGHPVSARNPGAK